MRQFIAGALLIAVALVVTYGIATVLQDMASSRAPQSAGPYVPPPIKGPMGKSKPGEQARVFMMSRRMNDDRNETEK